jgi:Clp amino terminal domain, pathogenicity island component
MTSTPDDQLVTAAQVARILGLTRRRVIELAESAPDFPPSEPARGRRWSRRSVEAWAANHPDRGPLEPGPRIPPIGRWPWQVRSVVDLAFAEARALNHPHCLEDHLLLALLHPDCPGTARAVLESFGIRAAPFRDALVAGLGDPYEPRHGGVSFPPGVQMLLERANLEALALADAEAASEHVLLALTGRWDGGSAGGWLRSHGVTADTLRQRVVDVTETGELPEPVPAPEPAWPGMPDPAPGLELAPTPDGRDPRERRPWGSVMFTDEEGRTFRYGLALRQYFIDRDGNPVLTSDGRPVHMLVDEHGNRVLDSEGRGVGPVEVPPGCRVEPAGER